MAVASLMAIVVCKITGRTRASLASLMVLAGVIISLTAARPTRHRDAQRIDGLARGERAAADRKSSVSAQHFLEQTRERAAGSIDRIFGTDAPMARALLIADQHRIPPEMRDRYARAGMVHMLSISGLHVAIIASAVILLLQALRLSAGLASALAVGLTGLYVAVIGAPAPAVRSAVMLGLVAASRATQRPTSPWAGLAIGAFAPLVKPATVLDLGYQLSVAGIAGLVASGLIVRRLFNGRISGWRLALVRNLLTSLFATVVTAPLIAWYFGRVSIIAPVANLVAGPVIVVLQPLLFLALVAAPIEAVARFLADAAHPLLAVFDTIASTASRIPGASIAVIPSIVTVVAGGAAVISLVVASASRYPLRPLIACSASLSFVVWSPGLRIPHGGRVELHVLDVGQGDAILLRTDRGNWVIFDAGRAWRTGDAGRSTIVPYVRMRGGNVMAFILSHAHADHAGGAVTVLRDLAPRDFWDSAFPQGSVTYDSTLRVARQRKIRWRRVQAGDEARFDGVLIRFLAPDSAWTASLVDPNEASTVARVEYGTRRFLLVGDAEAAEESWLLDRARGDLAADVLKVAHHGSSTSSGEDFLRAVNPALAVISVGADNKYGHPSADVLAALGRAGARTVRTDELGTVVIRTDGRSLTYEAAGETWDISRD